MKPNGNPLNVLVVMDSIKLIDPGKDSSFAMLLAAQRRGWGVLYAELDDIWIRDGHAYGQVTELHVWDDPNNWHELGDAKVVLLGDVDVILMRKDPPFDMEYVYATYILERAEADGALVVNNPQGLRNANEKAFVSWFPECSAPTLVSRSLSRLNDFVEEHGRVVVKPLDRMGGRSVFLTGREDPNQNVILESMSKHGSRYVLAQKYLADVVDSGDSRILLINGEPIPQALVRFAPKGDHRANICVGASTKTRPLTNREKQICDQLGPPLREQGLLFTGIDVIGGYLTEINVTSPTGIRELDQTNGTHIAEQLLDVIEAKVQLP